jgi:hypothetical protein
MDVTKGICHRTKEVVLADLDTCPDFQLMAKCRNCKAFTGTPGQAELGTCERSAHEPKFFTYPDLAAVTCRDYQAM